MRDSRTLATITLCGSLALSVSAGAVSAETIRVGIGQAEIELVGGESPVQRGRDKACDLTRPMNCRHLPAVLQHRGDVIAGLEAERPEAICDPANEFGPVAVGEPNLAINDSERIGVSLRGVEDRAPKIEHGATLATTPLRCPRVVGQ